MTVIGRGCLPRVPAVGSVLIGKNVQVHVLFFHDTDALPAVFVLLREGTLSQEGIGGMKIFLNQFSMGLIKEAFYSKEDLFAIDEVLTLENCSVRITKYAQNGLSANGELL